MASCANRFKDDCDEPCEWKLARKYGNARRKPGKCIYSGYESSYESESHTSKDSCLGACKWYPDGSKSHEGTCVYRKDGKDATSRLCGSPYGTKFVPIAQLVQHTIKRGGLPLEGEECRWIAKQLIGDDITATVANVAKYGRECLTRKFTSEESIDRILQRIMIGIAKNLNIENLGAVTKSDQEFVEQLKQLKAQLIRKPEDKKIVNAIIEGIVSGKFPNSALKSMMDEWDAEKVQEVKKEKIVEEKEIVKEEEIVKEKEIVNEEKVFEKELQDEADVNKNNLDNKQVYGTTKLKAQKILATGYGFDYNNYKNKILECESSPIGKTGKYWWSLKTQSCASSIGKDLTMDAKWRALINQYAKHTPKISGFGSVTQPFNQLVQDCENDELGKGIPQYKGKTESGDDIPVDPFCLPKQK
jgi:hypothetical protein